MPTEQQYRDIGVSDFQLEAANFLADGVGSARVPYRRALLLDEMRVGKTPSAIVAADKINAKTVLWLTMGSARGDHANDWKRFSLLDRDVNIMMTGKDKFRPGEVNITSYELACGGLWNEVSKHKLDLFVGDELHRCKNPAAKRTLSVFGPMCDGQGGYSKRAEYAWGLTGTLMPNNPSELWPVLNAWFPPVLAVDGEALGYEAFIQRYCAYWWMNKDNPYRRRRVITGGRNLDELRERLRPIYMRRRFAEVAPDVPPPVTEELIIEPKFPKEIMQADRDFYEIVQARSKKLSDPVEILAELSGEQQSRFRRMLAMTKAPGIANKIDEEMMCGEYDKIVVFAFHKDLIHYLKTRLAKYKPAVIDGATGAKKKLAEQSRFLTDPRCSVCIGQYVSAGAGINLSVANEMILAEPDYSFENVEQAIKRVMNIFKTEKVRVRFARSHGTMDKQITDVYFRKLSMFGEVFN